MQRKLKLQKKQMRNMRKMYRRKIEMIENKHTKELKEIKRNIGLGAKDDSDEKEKSEATEKKNILCTKSENLASLLKPCFLHILSIICNYVDVTTFENFLLASKDFYFLATKGLLKVRLILSCHTYTNEFWMENMDIDRPREVLVLLWNGRQLTTKQRNSLSSRSQYFRIQLQHLHIDTRSFDDYEKRLKELLENINVKSIDCALFKRRVHFYEFLQKYNVKKIVARSLTSTNFLQNPDLPQLEEVHLDFSYDNYDNWDYTENDQSNLMNFVLRSGYKKYETNGVHLLIEHFSEIIQSWMEGKLHFEKLKLSWASGNDRGPAMLVNENDLFDDLQKFTSDQLLDEVEPEHIRTVINGRTPSVIIGDADTFVFARTTKEWLTMCFVYDLDNGYVEMVFIDNE